MRERIKAIELNSGRDGAHLVVLAQIHGNEPCGEHAINRIVREIQNRKIRLVSGRLTLIPKCNPMAIQKQKRFMDINLNRIFKKRKNPKLYEERLANTLIDIIGKPSFMLDLHSFHTRGRKPITFAVRADRSRTVDRVKRRLPVDFCLNKWKEVQAAFGRPESFSTIDHAKSIGVPAIGVECGQHDAPSSRRVAYNCIIETMAELGICERAEKGRKNEAPKDVFFKYLRVYPAGAAFSRVWREFDSVRKGAIIGRLAGGEIVRAPFTGRMIFPNAKPVPGEEWFYIVGR